MVSRLSKIILHAQALQVTHLDVLKTRISRTEDVLNLVDPSSDQDLFIDHNIRPFDAPGDWIFEPCAVHYDTSEISVEPAPKVLLQNRLSKSRIKRQEMRPLMQAKGYLGVYVTSCLLAHACGRQGDRATHKTHCGVFRRPLAW